MTLMTLGKSLAGQSLCPPLSIDRAADLIMRGHGTPGGLPAELPAALALQGREHEQQRPIDDRADPVAAGWTYLIRADDPDRAELERAIAPLARWRGMSNTTAPLLYRGESALDWSDWIARSYYALALTRARVPRYVLILGSPEQVPFGLQTCLQLVASVGRLDFDRVADLEAYVRKVINLEQAEHSTVERGAVVFATDDGPDDPTHYSRTYMAEPMATRLVEHRFAVNPIMGSQATKRRLLSTLAKTRPALIYTASHGISAVEESASAQRAYNGAICCARTPAGGLDELVSAEDVPTTPFLEGAAVFQFACNGYGTPAVSDLAHRLPGISAATAGQSFVAALPKRLLAHPRGPISYVGHLDLAFLHGFTDPRRPNLATRWHHRVAPFVEAVDRLVDARPCGQALECMSGRLAIVLALITAAVDDQRRTGVPLSPMDQAALVDHWILRSDAKNYLLLGDPAVALRIPVR